MQKKKTWIMGLGVASLLFHTAAFGGSPAACEDAHQQYIAGAFQQVTERIVSCLKDPETSELLRANMMELLAHTYQQTRGNLPADFQLPAGMERLNLRQRRVDPPKNLFYAVELYGQLQLGRKLERLMLVKYPNEVILDSSASDGEDRELQVEPNGFFYLKWQYSTAQEEGLYKIVVKIEGEEASEQFVPVVDWASDRSPLILEPRPHEHFTTANPVVSWTPFSTGERGYDSRSFRIKVISHEAPDYVWKEVWTLDGDSGEATSYVVGKDGEGVKKLDAGRYLFDLRYDESRYYGKLKINKASNSRLVFFVQ